MPEIECDIVQGAAATVGRTTTNATTLTTDMVSGATHVPIFETTATTHGVTQKLYNPHHYQQYQQHQQQQEFYQQQQNHYKLLEYQQQQQQQQQQQHHKMATSSYVYRSPLTIPPVATHATMYDNISGNNNNNSSTMNNNNISNHHSNNSNSNNSNVNNSMLETFNNNFNHAISLATTNAPSATTQSTTTGGYGVDVRTTPPTFTATTSSSSPPPPLPLPSAVPAVAAQHFYMKEKFVENQQQITPTPVTTATRTSPPPTTFLQKSLEAPIKQINYTNGYANSVDNKNHTTPPPPPAGILAKTPQIRQSLSPNISTEAHLLTTNMATPPTWHAHVYGRPPNRPTPHTIADILGLRDTNKSSVSNINTTNNTSNTVNTALINSTLSHDTHDETSNSSVTNLPPAPAKSPKSILRNFQQQYSQQINQYEQSQQLHSASVSETSEDDQIATGVAVGPPSSDLAPPTMDQPLNLCVAKKSRESLSPPPAVKQNQILGITTDRDKTALLLGKHLKKGKRRKKFLYTLNVQILFVKFLSRFV